MYYWININNLYLFLIKLIELSLVIIMHVETFNNTDDGYGW